MTSEPGSLDLIYGLRSRYDVILLDEVHERHVSTDLLLGLMKGSVLKRAPNIRLILMSATVNLSLFAQYPPLTSLQ